MNWPPVMAWTRITPFNGERAFVAINYGLRKKSKWVDMVSVIDGQIYIRVLYEDLNEPSKWKPGWGEEKRSYISKKIKENNSPSKESLYIPSDDSGLSVPIFEGECRPWGT